LGERKKFDEIADRILLPAHELPNLSRQRSSPFQYRSELIGPSAAIVHLACSFRAEIQNATANTMMMPVLRLLLPAPVNSFWQKEKGDTSCVL
jgi:hypothetical protein